MKELNDDNLKKYLRIKESEEINPQFREQLIGKMEKIRGTTKKGNRKIRVSVFAAAASIMLFVLVFVVINQGNEIEIIDGKPTIDGNHIFTSFDKTGAVKLDDKTRVELKENTGIKILAHRSLEFINGQVTCDVSKNGPFIIKTKLADIKVLGTRFELRLDEKLSVKVFSGKVMVENAFGQQVLNANDTALCLQGSKPEKVQSKLEELQSLIKKLGDNDVETRDKSKDAIVKLIRDEARAKKDIKALVAELKKTETETKDEEVKNKISAIIELIPQGNWIPFPPSPFENNRTNTMCTLITGEKLIIWGGEINDKDGGYKFCTDGAIYNLKEDTWEKIPEAPLKGRLSFSIGGGDLGAKLIGENLVIWGGIDTTTGQKLHDGAIYNMKEKKWKKLPDLPFKEITKSTFLTSEGKLIVWLTFGKTFKSAQEAGVIYDFKEDQWTKLPDVPFEKRNSFTTILCGEKLLVWGGKSPNALKYYNDGAIYDLKETKWKKISIAPFYSTSQFQTVLFGDKLVLYGYFGKNNFATWKGVLRNSLVIYDLTKDAWSDILKAPIAAEDFYSTLNIIGDKLIAWGTSDTMGKPKSYGAIFDLKENKWKKIPEFPLEQRRSSLVVIADDKLIVWGGTNHVPMPNDLTPAPPDSIFKDGAIYSIKEDKWKKLPDLAFPSSGHCEYVPSLKQLVIIRGDTGAMCDLTTILSLTD